MKTDFQYIQNKKQRLPELLQALVSSVCLENCRLCDKELSTSAGGNSSARESDFLVADTWQACGSNNIRSELSLHSCRSRILVLLKAVINKTEQIIMQIFGTCRVDPAVMEIVAGDKTCEHVSDCLCQSCFDCLPFGAPLVGFYKLDSTVQAQLPIISSIKFEGKIRELIHRFKYGNDRLLANDLAFITLSAWSALLEFMPASDIILVPVPLHWQRKYKRGFNQSELLADSMAAVLNLPVKRALKRSRPTRPQQLLGRQERETNVRNAFVGDRHQLENKTVVLIDDVCTSGATLSECANAAIHGGARCVTAITIARAILYKKLSI